MFVYYRESIILNTQITYTLDFVYVNIYQPLKLLRYWVSIIAELAERILRRHYPFAFVSPYDLDLKIISK